MNLRKKVMPAVVEQNHGEEGLVFIFTLKITLVSL
jgi:hypothetical protein